MLTSKIKVKSWWGIALLTAMVTIVSPSSVKAEQDNMFEMIGSEDFLQMTAKMMNSSLPMMVDADTQWDSSSAGPGKTLSYNYTLTLFCHFAREILLVRELQPFLDFSYYYYQKIEQSFSL
jgi:hypothetical protein